MMRIPFGLGGKSFALPARLAAGLALLAIVSLFAMILAFAWPAFMQQGTSGIFSWSWQPYRGEFGILAMLVGSVLLSASPLMLAWPLSLLVCCSALASNRGPLLLLVPGGLRLMTPVPTVV